jgi:hypothetical protein
LLHSRTVWRPQTAEAIAAEPGWMASFLASLARDDLAPATLRG